MEIGIVGIMRLSRAMWFPRAKRLGASGASRCDAVAAGSFCRDQDGVAAVELAMVLPFLMVLLVGIIDFSALFFLRNNMFTIARDSARALAVQSVTAVEAEQMIRNRLDGWNATFTVDVHEPDPSDPNDTDVVMTISVPMAQAAPIGLVFDMVGFTGTMQSQVTMRQEG